MQDLSRDLSSAHIPILSEGISTVDPFSLITVGCGTMLTAESGMVAEATPSAAIMILLMMFIKSF